MKIKSLVILAIAAVFSTSCVGHFTGGGFIPSATSPSEKATFGFNAHAEDTDNDGRVAFADFLVVSSNFGKKADVVWEDGDFDANGKIVWTLTNDDLPGDWLQDPCGGQVLPNGNVVITSYAAGRADRHAPKLFEVTRNKKVVWKYADGQAVGIHHFQIVTTNGAKLAEPALK